MEPASDRHMQKHILQLQKRLQTSPKQSCCLHFHVQEVARVTNISQVLHSAGFLVVFFFYLFFFLLVRILGSAPLNPDVCSPCLML